MQANVTSADAQEYKQILNAVLPIIAPCQANAQAAYHGKRTPQQPKSVASVL